MKRENRSAGIVGGSIAGCAAAVLLCRAGWEVTVFERASGELEGRGAGINLFNADLQRFIRAGLLDSDIPTCRVHQYRFHWSAADHGGSAPQVGAHQVDSHALHWGELHGNLRRRVPDACYRGDSDVVALRQADHTALVTLADGSEHAFDLVISADGYQSLGRALLCPDDHVEYAGYVAWRGLLAESALDCRALLQDAVVSIGLPAGLTAFYFVPGAMGNQVGQRLVNWLIYHRVDAHELPAFLRDKNGLSRSGTVPPGLLREDHEAELKALAQGALPSPFADICMQSQDTFVQAIHQACVPHYAVGRICLLGDAGALASPVSTAGALKAMDDAISLAQALTSTGDLDTELMAWSGTRCAEGNYLSRFGQQRARAMILQNKDWGGMDADSFTAWFAAVNTLDEC